MKFAKRIAAFALAAVVTLSALPVNAWAVEQPPESGLCEHHTAHDADCGYAPATAEQPCTHQHGESCGYAAAVEEMPCDKGCADTDGDGAIDHSQDCAYVPAAAEFPCQHTHDETCSYTPATEEKPCTYVCEICNAPSLEDTAQCTCDTVCTEGVAKTDCPVCAADLTACKGQPPVPETTCTCDILCTGDAVNIDCPICRANLTTCCGTIASDPEPAPTPKCDCTVLCLAGDVKSDCPVCGAENADLSQCVGGVAEVAINGNTTRYPIIEDAFKAARGNTATITLLRDVTGSVYLGSITDGTITLNLNGKTLDSSHFILWIARCTLTITGNGYLGEIDGPGNIILEGGTINRIWDDFSGKITVKGGTINYIKSENATIDFQLQSVALDESELYLSVNEEADLTATVVPYMSVPGFPVWESNDDTVVTVDQNGKITAVGEGSATITVTAGDKTATCAVTVGEKAAEVTIDGKTKGYPTIAQAIDAANGNTATITLLKEVTGPVDVSKITGGAITLNLNGKTFGSSVSCLSVEGGALTITGNGYLKEIDGDPDGDGTIILENGTLDTINSQFFGKVIVKGGTINCIDAQNATIEFQPQNLTLSPATLSLLPGETADLSAAVSPEIHVPGFGYTWSTNDDKVAAVDRDGKVAAVGEGTATITVKAGDKIADCTVTVGAVPKKSLDQLLTDGKGQSQVSITLTEDDQLTYHHILSGSLNLDLQGYQLSGSGSIQSSQSIAVTGIGGTTLALPEGGKIQLGSGKLHILPSQRINAAGVGVGYSCPVLITAGGSTYTYFLGMDAHNPGTLTLDLSGKVSVTGQYYSGKGQLEKPGFYIVYVSNANTYYQGSWKDLNFVSNAPVEALDLSRTTVDGAIVPEKYRKQMDDDFAAVTLTNAFLRTLRRGSHTLTLYFNDGQQASATFSVRYSSAYDPTNPKTSDGIFLPMTILPLSAAALTLLLQKQKKSRRK